MKHLCAVLACLVVLAGCQFGEPASLFDEDLAIERSVAALRQRIGMTLLALSVAVTPDVVTIRAQNSTDRKRIDEWRLARVSMAGFSWERVTGPQTFDLNLVNPDLEANLFDLDTVDFKAATSLLRAATERAALADKARVIRVEIARQPIILPRPSSGEVRWTVDVASDRESAQIFANARGTIVGANLSSTMRAKTLDFFAKPELLAEAVENFRFVLGSEPILVRVTVNPQTVGFETTLPDPNSPIPVSGSLSVQRVYIWTINGLQRTLGRVAVDSDPTNPHMAVFGIEEIDWTVMPKILAAAKQQLAMPQGRISGIELSKPMNIAGPLALVWKIELTNPNNEKGFVLADAAGRLRQVVPPQSQRKTIDWYDPKTMVDTFQRLATEFGQDRQYAEITFLGDKVIGTTLDHMQPNSFSQILLSDAGLQRVGTAAMGAAMNVPFRIGDISALTVDRIRDLETKTLETLKLSTNTFSSITIGRGSLDPSPNGNVTIEIRVEEKPFGRAGRVNYELDGTVIRAYLP